jgi:beta-galactosidase
MRYGIALLSAVMTFLGGTMPASIAESAKPVDQLLWPTSVNQIQLFRHHGIRTGSVTRGTRTFDDWGEDSTVTWTIVNNVAGAYKPTLTYSSANDATCTLEIDGHRYQSLLKKGDGVLKHSGPAVMLSRIGPCRVSLSVSAEGAENSFTLSDFRLRQVVGDVTMSKPVLIAGADWLKVQGSLQVISDEVKRSDVAIEATLRPWPEGGVLWSGRIPATTVAAGLEIDHTITDLRPALWSPATPNLYTLTMNVFAGTQDQPALRVESRIGFRDFKAKDGRFYLNGTPVFLRGNSIVPPGGGVTRNLNPDVAYAPDEIRKYLRYLKERNVNMIRAQDPLWLSMCDEVGLMVFVGRYGAPGWKDAARHHAPEFDESAVTYYKQLFAEKYMNSPSVVMWVLSNELPSAMSEMGKKYTEFLRQCYLGLKEWDPSRAYIDNAGFGLGQTGDVNDFHVYVGWYNGTTESTYKFRHDLRALAGLPSPPTQPMTFTEVVGAYTDEFGRMPGTDKQVSAGVMWGGNESDIPEVAQGYQSYLAREFIEIVRRIRSENPTIAGVMPFTTSANRWEDATSVEEIDFKPIITEAYPKAYQPVLLSFANKRPHVYPGDALRIPVYLVNDDDEGRDLSGAVLQWRLINDADQAAVVSGTLPFAPTVKHYATDRQDLVLETDKALKDGRYTLVGDVLSDGKTISSNDTSIWIEAPKSQAVDAHRKISLFDPLGETGPILERAGMKEGRDYYITTSPFAAMKKLDNLTGAQLQETLGVEEVTGDTLVAPSRSLFIVGATQWVEPLRDKYLLMQEFIDRGGRVLFLHPNAAALNDIGIYKEISVSENDWVGDRASVTMESLWHTSRFFGAFINPRRSDTGIFDSIERQQLWWWSDSSGWDQTKEGLPRTEPVSTLMKLRGPDALGTTAILANFGRGLEHVALAEVFRGKGSVMLSGFDFERFVGFDPIADRVLRGIVKYAADDTRHAIVPVAKESTNIGSPSDEDGIVPSEFRNGLLLEYTKDYQVRRIAGPFWFNRLCHTKFLDPDNEERSGFMHVRAPSGKTHLVVHARRVPTRENRGKYEPEKLSMSIGELTAEGTVAGEEEVTVRIPLPETAGQTFRVDFQGVSDIGITRMSFE